MPKRLMMYVFVDPKIHAQYPKKTLNTEKVLAFIQNKTKKVPL
jgi:hypothetical protein